MGSRGIVVVLLLMALILGGCVRPTATATGSDRVQPLLLEKAVESPEAPISLIVQTAPGAVDRLAAAVRAWGGVVTERWEVIHAFAAELRAGRAPALARLPGVRYISWDAPVAKQNVGDDKVNPAAVQTAFPFAIGADQVWNQGYHGENVTVAVVDSGIDDNGTPGDLSGRITTGVVISPRAIGKTDAYGHGTYVAGILAGDGAMSNQAYVGIAPRALVASVKVSDEQGVATTKDLITGLVWIYYNQRQIKVVNISMQSTIQLSYLVDPLDAAVEQLWHAGIVVVVSAGNNGGQVCSVCYSPANDPYVITVGAVDDQGTQVQSDDALAAWSSWGTTQDGFGKPDIFAPGSHIWSELSSANGSNPLLAQQWPANVSANRYYFRMGGTSAAAPVVSGAVALLLQVHPTWTPNQVKWVLVNTARPFVGQPAGFGGEVRIDQAVAYSGTPGSANAGLTPAAVSTLLGGTSSSTVQWSNVQWSNSGDY